MSGLTMFAILFGLACALAGYMFAFRQAATRRWLERLGVQLGGVDGEGDDNPLTYIFRIAGMMFLAFGVALAGMFILVSRG